MAETLICLHTRAIIKPDAPKDIPALTMEPWSDLNCPFIYGFTTEFYHGPFVNGANQNFFNAKRVHLVMISAAEVIANGRWWNLELYVISHIMRELEPQFDAQEIAFDNNVIYGSGKPHVPAQFIRLLDSNVSRQQNVAGHFVKNDPTL